MTAPPMTTPAGAVDVVRPSPAQQVAAGLAAGAALVAVATLGATLSTLWYTGEGEDAGSSLSRVAWGETLTGYSGVDYGLPSVPWGGPMVLVILLCTGAAVAGLLASRSIGGANWVAVARLLAVAGTGLTAGVMVVLWRVAVADIETGNTTDEIAAIWGPAFGLLCLVAVLAAASAIVVGRAQSVVIARVSVTS